MSDGSVLCVDPKPGPTDIGHADGYTSRTLEMLASLGLESEITTYGRRISEVAQWQRTANGELKRLAKSPMSLAPARFHYLHTMHQGRFERMLVNDLRRYSKNGILRNAAVADAKLDESDREFPVVVTVKMGDETRTVRTKYLVAADGAHSKVRQCFNVPMTGETVDKIFGVCDFVPDTSFPDIRRSVLFFKR